VSITGFIRFSIKQKGRKMKIKYKNLKNGNYFPNVKRRQNSRGGHSQKERGKIGGECKRA
jgi:hypothetical protein